MNTLFTLSGSVARALAALTMLLLGALVLLISADVGLRATGFKPMAWVPDAAEYILLYAAFLPAPALVRSKGHVFVEFLRAPLPEGAKRALERAVYLICLVICAYLAWIAGAHLVAAVRTGAFDARAVDMPRWLVYLPMATGLALAALEWLRFLLGADSMYALDPAQMDGY